MSVAAELWALRDGTSLCISLSLLAVEFEFGAKLVVDPLSQANDPSSANDAILADCREGLKHISFVKIQHCYREANKCADALARRGVNLYQDFVIFLDLPVDVLLLLNLDASSLLYERSTQFASITSNLMEFPFLPKIKVTFDRVLLLFLLLLLLLFYF